MKKQINPTIKAHLVRSAFYVLLLLAVCVIPLALAQSGSRKTNKQAVTKQKVAANPKSVAPGAHAPASMVTNATSDKSKAAPSTRFSRASRIARRPVPQGSMLKNFASVRQVPDASDKTVSGKV